MTGDPKCPFCSQSIGVWTVMKAPLPSAIRCPHCRAKIKVANVGVYLVGYILVVLAVTALLITAFRRRAISSGLLIVLAIFGLGTLEFIVSAIVLRRARFVKPGA